MLYRLQDTNLHDILVRKKWHLPLEMILYAPMSIHDTHIKKVHVCPCMTSSQPSHIVSTRVHFDS